MSDKRDDDGKTVGDEDQTITAPTPPQGKVSVPADEKGEDDEDGKTPRNSGRRP